MWIDSKRDFGGPHVGSVAAILAVMASPSSSSSVTTPNGAGMFGNPTCVCVHRSRNHFPDDLVSRLHVMGITPRQLLWSSVILWSDPGSFSFHPLTVTTP